MLNELNPTMESTGEEGTKITLNLPEGRLSPLGIRKAIKAVTGVKMELNATSTPGVYTFAKKYRYQMLRGLLNVYSSVTVITTSTIETTEDREVCNFSCVDAYRDLCECGCDGRYHKGGYGAIAGWTSLGGGAVTTGGEVTVDHLTDVHVYTNESVPADLLMPQSLESTKKLLKTDLTAAKRARVYDLLEFETNFFEHRKDAYFGRFFMDQEISDATVKELQDSEVEAPDNDESGIKRD